MIHQQSDLQVQNQQNMHPNVDSLSENDKPVSKMIVRSFTDLEDSNKCRFQKETKSTHSQDLQSATTKIGNASPASSDQGISEIQMKTVKVKITSKCPKPPQGNLNNWKLSHNGHLISDSDNLKALKYYFTRTAQQFKMGVLRDTGDTLTVKADNVGALRSVLTMCLPFGTERAVFQLSKGKKGKNSVVRVVLIDGMKEDFYIFKFSYYLELWRNNVLNLSQNQAIKIMCFVNKKIIYDSIQDYEKGCDHISSQKEINEQEIQDEQNVWIKKLKLSFRKMQKEIFKNIEDPSLKIIELNEKNSILVERVVMNMVPVWQYYLKLQMKANKEFLQKKKVILRNSTLSQIFSYLQIDQKLLTGEFSNLEDSILNLMLQNKQLPYISAVKVLEELNMNLSPSQNVHLVGKFTQQLRNCYAQVCGESEAVLDMDNQLPLTIYCLVISKNSQLKTIAHFLFDYFLNEDSFEVQNRTLADLKAALEYIRNQWSLNVPNSESECQQHSQNEKEKPDKNQHLSEAH